MNDRELLEYAAKAIGYEGRYNLVEAFQLYKNGEYVKFWNPLTDDGDALRLAVKLNINIEHLKTMGNDYAGVHCWPIGRGDCDATEENENDKLLATRRAIVRASAEIGKAKP